MPEWPSYGNFGKVTQNSHFLKKVQKGDEGKFLKNRPTGSYRLKGPKQLWRKRDYPLICMHFQSKDWKRFWRKKLLQNCPNGQVIAIFARSPKPAFSEKLQRGDQGKFFKNHAKRNPRLKGLKALWRNWHYPVVSIRL